MTPHPPASAKAVLTQVVKALALELAPRGFQRKDIKLSTSTRWSALVRQGPEVLTMIEFQVGRGATKTDLRFVINYGVVCKSLVRPGLEDDAPTYTDCHWGARVVGSDAIERWWTVSQADSPDELLRHSRAAIEEQVLPASEAMQTEAALLALWETGRSPRLGHEQRLLFLALLLHKAGRFEEFARVRAELAAEPPNPFVQAALERLGALG